VGNIVGNTGIDGELCCLQLPVKPKEIEIHPPLEFSASLAVDSCFRQIHPETAWLPLLLTDVFSDTAKGREASKASIC
jgi:hypothetical protein